MLETTPCYIITESLADSLFRSRLTGIKIEAVQISKDDEFNDLFPNVELPAFKRLTPMGSVVVEGLNFKDWSKYDFCLSETSRLVVTQEALAVLKRHKLDFYDITVLT